MGTESTAFLLQRWEVVKFKYLASAFRSIFRSSIWVFPFTMTFYFVCYFLHKCLYTVFLTLEKMLVTFVFKRYTFPQRSKLLLTEIFFLLEVKLFKPCLFVVIFTTLTQVINERICFYLSTFSCPVLSSFYLSKGSQSVLWSKFVFFFA